MRIIDWSSDVCSADLEGAAHADRSCTAARHAEIERLQPHPNATGPRLHLRDPQARRVLSDAPPARAGQPHRRGRSLPPEHPRLSRIARSEEHTSELQSLMRISYAVFCLKKKNQK